MDTVDIQSVCSRLNDKAVAIGLFSGSIETLKARVNAFVRQCCLEQKLRSHLISPFRWRFNKDGHGIRSGLVEFDLTADANLMAFTWVDVSDSKITEKPRLKLGAGAKTSAVSVAP